MKLELKHLALALVFTLPPGLALLYIHAPEWRAAVKQHAYEKAKDAYERDRLLNRTPAERAALIKEARQYYPLRVPE